MERSSPLEAVAAIHYFWEYLSHISPYQLQMDFKTQNDVWYDVEGKDKQPSVGVEGRQG
jgi:hypothetical protein